MNIGAGNLYGLGSTGGSKDAIVVSHTHTATVTDPGHLHTGTVGAGASSTPGGAAATVPLYAVSMGTATTGITVANSTTGVSGTNANLPPYFADYEIIKA